MPISFNATDPLTAPHQLVPGVLAPGGARAMELRVLGTTSAGCGLVPARGELGQIFVFAAGPGGGNFSFRIADGVDHAELLAGLDTIAEYVRNTPLQTDQNGAAEVMTFLRNVRDRIRMDQIRGP
jgi:hypothetical protein